MSSFQGCPFKKGSTVTKSADWAITSIYVCMYVECHVHNTTLCFIPHALIDTAAPTLAVINVACLQTYELNVLALSPDGVIPRILLSANCVEMFAGQVWNVCGIYSYGGSHCSTCMCGNVRLIYATLSV